MTTLYNNSNNYNNNSLFSLHYIKNSTQWMLLLLHGKISTPVMSDGSL